ncbi:hypothetical protein TOPH_02499 [Tolypocladium ophioglossoides CBS 100239]|uniref:Uncharacterized protein n=1 Tax=Tolypocladium ophioglossoides (strain CBS 100239) TaxID=1163406 RepID=A0A0L0NF31_TOLOC|nr:hypothetical protein TOPH_02499 [Tolypocladium ophioglossoides CBS 100239]
MAEFDTSEADTALQPAHADDDLIDYDSDDVSVKNSDMQRALEPGETHTLDVGVTSSETKPAVRDASDSAETTHGVRSLSETVGLDANITTQEGNNSEGHTYEAQEGVKTIADAGPTATSVPNSHVSIHEIDYDHDGLAYDTNGDDNSEQLSAAAHDDPLSAAKSSLPTNVAEYEAERYEIDWEDDEAANDNVTPDATAQDATQRDTVDVNDVGLAVGDDAQGNTAEGVDPADPTTYGSMAAQAAPESDLFPDITVVYKGEAYPMFAYTADGFFSNVSLIDETIKTVLDAFRAELELHNDLGPHDELVFQVDKLGLEFSEARILDHVDRPMLTFIQSSPPETLSMTTMRQILEILDILVKNENFDSSRTLTTYLFTKPNAMKQFEFLVESATDKNKGLAQVIYYFRPPFNPSDYDGTNAIHGYGEQLADVEGAGDDEYTENHESIEDEDAAYEYDDDGHVDNHEGDGGDEAAEHHDGGIDYSTDDTTAAANDKDDRADDFGGNGAEPATNREDDLIDYTDDKIASNDGQDHVEHSASAGTGTVSNHNEEELIDYSDDKIADDYAGAYPLSSDRPGFAANDEEDLIDYTDDKNSAADEDDLIGYGSGSEANEGAEEGAQDPLPAGHEDGGKGAEHHDATSEHDANHAEHGVDLVDYSNGYTYTAVGNNAVSYDPDYGDLIDYSSDKCAAGTGNVASHVEEGQVSVGSVQEGVAQSEATQVDATGNATGKYQNSHLEVGARHSRNASDISITFSAADADGVLPAHAQSASIPALGFGLDELAHFDYAVSEGTQASVGQHPTEGGIATAGTTESSTTATLGNDDDAAMNLNPAVGQDELSEIDWREDPVPTVGGGVPDAQSNTLKRAHPNEMDAQDGNDVKRRRS